MALGLNITGSESDYEDVPKKSRGRPAGGYFVDGVRVPSVTEIISRFKPIQPLMHWSWQQGKLGLDYRGVRDDAAAIGSIAHQMIEADIRGEPFVRMFVETDKLALADRAYHAFREWRKTTTLRPLATEISLTSREWRFGGTFDALMAGNDLVLCDWKTSKFVYPEFVVQLAAYRALWEENNPGRKIASVGIVHLDKATGKFAYYHFVDTTSAWRASILLRELYDLEKEITKTISSAGNGKQK